MNNQATLDKSAIAISVVCAVHCLALPIVTVMYPSLIGYFFAEESFHRWLSFVVLPLSVTALWMGCRHHKSVRVSTLGAAGLLVLVFAALFGHDVLGEAGEKVATVIGAGLIAIAHYLNFRLCLAHRNCSCFD